MAQKLLVIEMNERFVKACVTLGSGKNAKILQNIKFEIIGDLISDGQITNVNALAEQIKAAFKEHDIANIRRGIFTFTSGKVATREVVLPEVKPNQIASLVELNASEYFPVDISGYQLAHSVVGKDHKNESGIRVLVTAVPKQILRSYIELGDMLEIWIESIDYAPNGQYQILKNIKSEEVIMYVNVNVKSTTATFIKDGKLLLQRNLPFGGDELFSAIMQKYEMDDHEYLKILDRCSDGEWLMSILSEDEIIENTARFTNGIKRSMEFFKSSQRGMLVDKIYLLGDCAKIFSLDAMVTREVDTPCSVFRADIINKNLVKSFENASDLISAVGSLIEPLKLIPDEFTKKSKKKRQYKPESKSLYILVSVGLFLIGVAMAGTAILENLMLEQELEQVNSRIEELIYVETIRDEYVEYKTMNDNLNVFINESLSYNDNLVALIEELEQKMPSNFRALSVVCTANTVVMNIEVNTFEEVAVTLENLKAFESIMIVDFSSATEQEGLAGNTVSFSVTCTYEPIESNDLEELPTGSLYSGIVE